MSEEQQVEVQEQNAPAEVSAPVVEAAGGESTPPEVASEQAAD